MLKICAVIAVHNNTYTISRVLEHYKKNKIEVIIINDGSTDETLEIINQYKNDPVKTIHTLEFDGTFNLNKVLEEKKHIVSNLNTHWFIHADADEIFESPFEGESLRDFIERQESIGVDVIDCDEFVFVPENESANYSPKKFIEKMVSYYYFNKPGRSLYRFIRMASGVIEWDKSGGHRVNLSNRTLAQERIRLRHYIGLSLDHIRAQYYSRVFSAQGILNRWHGTRIATTPHFVQSPPSTKLFNLKKDGWCTNMPQHEHLIFNQSKLSKKKIMRKPVTASHCQPTLIFVIGNECSGIDLLKSYFDYWSSFVCSSKTTWLTDFFQRILSDNNDKNNTSHFTSNPTWKKMGIESSVTENFLQRGNVIEPAKFLRQVFHQYVVIHGGKLYCDFSPQHLTLMYDIAATLPEVRFIHVIRDGRDVAASARETAWGKQMSISELAINWTWNIREARQQAQFLPHYLEVRYETLAENPAQVLKQIANFLESPLFQPGINKDYDNEKDAEAIIKFLQNKVLSPLPGNDLVDRYKTELSKREIIQFERIAENLLCDLGYTKHQSLNISYSIKGMRSRFIENLYSKIKKIPKMFLCSKKNSNKNSAFKELKTQQQNGSFLSDKSLTTNIKKSDQQTRKWSYNIDEKELLNLVKQYNAQKNQRKAKVVCYTAIDGISDYVIIPEVIVNEWDYVVFTNRTIEGDHIFEVRKPSFNLQNPLFSLAYLKLHPHIFFPEYEYSVWLDPSILVQGDHLRETIDMCFQDHTLIMLNQHPGHSTMQQRLETCIRSQNKFRGLIVKQIQKYYEQGLLETSPFYDTRILIRDHNIPEIIEMNKTWWHEVISGIKSDQLSLPYIIWKSGLSPDLMRVKLNPQNRSSKDYRLFQNKFTRLRNTQEYTMPKFLRILPSTTSESLKEEKFDRYQFSKIDFFDIKKKLYRLGFVQRAYNEMYEIFCNAKNIRLKQKAAWELSLWHANSESYDDAKKSLEFLEAVTSQKMKLKNIQKAITLRAECYKKLGKIEKSEKLLLENLSLRLRGDILLSMVYISKTVDKRIYWFNKTFDFFNLSPIKLLLSKKSTNYERLTEDIPLDRHCTELSKNILVSIIMPTYNAQDNIHIALNSLLSQTWKNIEIIVADDCSTDNTILIVEDFMRGDKRIKLVRLSQNQGTYVARNFALREAIGEFVTCHDSDDWSHPEKIEIQVRHLLKNKHIVANTSQLVRVTDDLVPIRRGNSSFYIQTNYSSLMFRRKEVVMNLGYWDSVRFGADSEMIYRIERFFGAKCIEHLKTGPLMLALQSEQSLTSDSRFGINGSITGARAEYRDSFFDYQNSSEDLYHDFSMTTRKFPVPEPMKPNREVSKDNKRHFDVVFAFDFRLNGKITDLLVEEISKKACTGTKIGLVQFCLYDVSVSDYPKISGDIRQIIDGKKVQLIVYGEQITCDVLYIKHPSVLMDYQIFIPEIDAKEIIIEDGIKSYQNHEIDFLKYDRKRCENNILKYFHKEGKWLIDEQ